MSADKKRLTDKQRIKKMSKTQMQLAIIKKKQCDVRALAIVEQLLEPKVKLDWLLKNLQFINKSHMEDVIQERAIIKLCGYVLCSKPLTVIIKQQYHISTRRNKVYDISKRKNFCSSLCYGSSNYLLEQMFESPLWLREKEDIPVFKILSVNSNFNSNSQCIPGDEVIGMNILQNIDTDNTDKNEKPAKPNTTEKAENNVLPTIMSPKIENSSYLSNDMDVVTGNVKVQEISINTDLQNLLETYLSELYMNQESKNCNSQKCINSKNDSDDYNIQEENVELTPKTQISIQSKNIYLHEGDDRNVENKNIIINVTCSNNDNKSQSQLDEASNRRNDINERLQPESDEINSNNDDSKMLQLNEINNSQNNDNKSVQFQLDEMCSSSKNIVISSESSKKHRKGKDINRISKIKKCKEKECDGVVVQTHVYYKVIMHVEQSVKEWITESTRHLLLGVEDEKCQLLENLAQHDRYERLCKKLNRLLLEDEREDRINLERNELKPLPDFSVLQERGKKMELKVCAFYGGQMMIGPSEDNKDSKSKDDNLILPLTNAHAPNIFRRRIFLEKLSKILPDLLRTLTTNTSLVAQCTYNNERYSLVKLLINTFNLSASNIVFKTAEWTLIGLIIIKMLGLIDAQWQSLLRTKQASTYMTMILMSYKLDSRYLDRFVMEVINNMDTSKSDNK